MFVLSAACRKGIAGRQWPNGMQDCVKADCEHMHLTHVITACKHCRELAATCTDVTCLQAKE